MEGGHFLSVVKTKTIDEMYVTVGCKINHSSLHLSVKIQKTLFFCSRALFEGYVTDQIQGHTARESEITVYTDEYKMYPKLESEKYKHKTVNYSIEYANGNTHINNCENRHSLLRPFLMIRRGVSKYKFFRFLQYSKNYQFSEF